VSSSILNYVRELDDIDSIATSMGRVIGSVKRRRDRMNRMTLQVSEETGIIEPNP